MKYLSNVLLRFIGLVFSEIVYIDTFSVEQYIYWCIYCFNPLIVNK